MSYLRKIFGLFGIVLGYLILTASQYVILNPTGAVAKMESNLIVISTILMLLIVIPVMIAVIILAWKYRANNKKAEYLPEWGHSVKAEVYMWGIPTILIIILGAITAYYSIIYDPFRRLPIETDKPPLTVQVVALNWKWLFIYPEQNIATINELYIPTDREIAFDITSTDNVNAFWVPALGSMIYAMPGMRTKVHYITDKTGVFAGSSANYSGKGFSGMRFKTYAVTQPEFEQWVATVKQSQLQLDVNTYLGLVEPSESEPVKYFSETLPGLFYRVANRCVKQGEVCIETKMMQAASQTLWGSICSGAGFTPYSSSRWGDEAAAKARRKLAAIETN
ncbi:ubiquinol oxidase subunit II [Bartonella sp. DGB1]|uniref:ubiquinol oxidase subunit II n=1 Tax=Bartonella sp. DGB1 TaxID=3239807 RepID=UPI0035235A3C